MNSGDQHAFLYSEGSIQDIGTLEGTWSYAYGVNNSGQVVGYSETASGMPHAFLYSAGNMQDLGTFAGGTYSLAYGINNLGQVVGYSETAPSVPHAFLYSAGNMQDLGTLPGGVASQAYGINNLGQVVGWSTTASNDVHGFLYNYGGPMIDLNNAISPASGWTLEWVYGINDKGQVIGAGTNQDGQFHAFLLIPSNYASPSATFFMSPVTSGKIFKLGSTIPLKFQLVNRIGEYFSTAVANVKLLKSTSDVPVGEPIDATSTSAADTGNKFRYSSTDNLYIYNLNTEGLDAGTWQVIVTLDNGSVKSTFIALK